MAEIINLRLARKAKKRRDATAQADANRAMHGRTRAEKAAAETERARAEKALDGAKLELDGAKLDEE
jgi:hypothetical protein